MNNDFKNYSGENPETKTNQNLETINKLFDESGYGDKSVNTFDESEQSFNSGLLSHNIADNLEGIFDNSNDDFQTDSDSLDKTQEISSVNLEELKAIQEELHRLYDEPSEPTQDSSLEGESQSKGKSLTKATKQGIAFSNGSLTRTFLDCAILCFVTASIGFMFLTNIINHI